MTKPSLVGETLRLLVGGLIGGNIAGVTVVATTFLLGAKTDVGWALMGIGLVLAFFFIGHWVQLLVVDRHPKVILLAAVSSYIVRVTALGIALTYFLANQEWFQIATLPFIGGTIVTVIGWLIGEVIAFKKMRVLVFDNS